MQRGATCTKGTQVARSSAYVAGRGIESLDSGVSSQLAPFALKLPHGKECAVIYLYILRAYVTREDMELRWI